MFLILLKIIQQNQIKIKSKVKQYSRLIALDATINIGEINQSP